MLRLCKRVVWLGLSVALVFSSFQPGAAGTRVLAVSVSPAMSIESSLRVEDYWTLDKAGAIERVADSWPASPQVSETTAAPMPLDAVAPVPSTAVVSTTVAAGDYLTCATVDGAAQCWGYNDVGQLGVGRVGSSSLEPMGVVGLTSGVSLLTAGADHACVLAGGRIKCWGSNFRGMAGVSVGAYVSVPVTVTGMAAGALAVDAGDRHTCAVDGGGGVACWGWDYYGQLGDGPVDNSGSTPVAVDGLTAGVISLSAGLNYTCAVDTAGGLLCWGVNDHGQLGNGSTSTAYKPVKVTGLSSGAVAVEAGAFHACAVIVGGGVECWGRNAEGQLGARMSGSPQKQPVAVYGLDSGVQALALGGFHSCALMVGGSVKCWGSNDYGELGVVTTTARINFPVDVDLSAVGGVAVALAAGSDHTCAVMSDGGISCWGGNWGGQLGDGTKVGRWRPQRVDKLLYSATGQVLDTESSPVSGVRISAGGMLSTTTDVSGRFTLGNLIAGAYTITPSRTGYTFDPPSRPVSVPPGASDQNFTATVSLGQATLVSAGAEHTCAVFDGSAKCWGLNEYGQLGFGSTDSVRLVPADVVGLSSGVTEVSAGNAHSCALAGGLVKCWGNNSDGRLGNRELSAASSPTPVEVEGLAEGVVAVSAGGAHNCALTGLGAVQCWGSDYVRQLGNGDGDDTGSTPVSVLTLTTGVRAISAGSDSTCAITGVKSVMCWGNNAVGGLGNNRDDAYAGPVDVLGLGGVAVKAIAGGTNKAAAVTEGGAAKYWGGGVLPPITIAGLEAGVQAVTLGAYHACALMENGGVKCWGENGKGQLGIDSTIPSSSVPMEVVGLPGRVVAIDAGWWHTCAVMDDGELVCWGGNPFGQLGDGTRVNRFRPVRVAVHPNYIAGTVLDRAGMPLPEVTVIAGNGVSATTGLDGSYLLNDLLPGTYTITPTRTGMTFSPASRTITVPVSARGQDFAATNAPASGVDLRLEAPFGGSSRYVGEIFTYTLRYENYGIRDLTNVIVTATFEGNLHPQVVTNSTTLRGSCGGQSEWHFAVCGWGLGTVQAGASGFIDLVITANEDSDYVLHTAEFKSRIFDDSRNGPDETPENNVGGSWVVKTVCDCNSSGPSRCCLLAWIMMGCTGPVDLLGGVVREAQEALSDVQLFYRVRNEVLSTTPAGRRYVDLYNANSPEIVSAFASNPALVTETRSLIQTFRPSLQALVDGQGITATITLTQAQAVDTYLDHLSAAVGPSLQGVIAEERAKTPPSSFVDKTVDQVRRELAGSWVYLPVVTRGYGGGQQAGW